MNIPMKVVILSKEYEHRKESFQKDIQKISSKKKRLTRKNCKETLKPVLFGGTENLRNNAEIL